MKLANHSEYWLRDDAAVAFNEYEAKYGIIRVTSAGRTIAEQNTLIARYDRGGIYNRPPYLYAPARPATASYHVRDGGIAIDSPDWQKFARHCEEFGFVHPYPYDPVHFEYRKRYSASSPASLQIPVGGLFVRINDYPYATYRVPKGHTPRKTAAVWGMSLKRFYALNNINPDKGFASYPVGLEVRIAYDYMPLSRRTLSRGREGADVATVQEHLNSVYPTYSDLVLDGIFGPSMESTVKEFQRRSFITVDGIIGPATWTALGI